MFTTYSQVTTLYVLKTIIKRLRMNVGHLLYSREGHYIPHDKKKREITVLNVI